MARKLGQPGSSSLKCSRGNDSELSYGTVLILFLCTQPQNGTMWTLALFLVSVVVGYLVLRYRVHVIVVVRPRPATTAQRSATALSKRTPEQPTSDSAPVLEIASALVNLGCKPRHAKTAAERACASGGRDFDGLLRIAIQEALTC